jgi:hypothetical protein
MSLSPTAKVVQDQQSTASDPLKNPFFSMQVACSIIRELEIKLGKTGPLHPYIIAMALKFGANSEILNKVLSLVDPYDCTSKNSMQVLTNFQAWAFELKLLESDILFLDSYQKVYDETTMNNLNTQF